MSGPNLSPAETIRERSLSAAIGASHHLPQVHFDAAVPANADTAVEADAMNAFARTVERADIDRVLRIARRFESYIRAGTVITDDDVLAELEQT